MVRITDKSVQEFETRHIAAVRQMAAECTVLLKSSGILPLAGAGKIALFGNGARKTIKGGTGSGDVNVRHYTTVEEGLEKAGFTVVSKEWLRTYDEIMVAARKDFIAKLKAEAKQPGQME